MPKIPMAEKAGLIRHESSTVHMTGAPNLNWKLDEGQALIDMGDKLGRGAEKLGNAMMAFGQHMQHQEDVLAATEDRNLFHKLNGELHNKLANTPGATDEEKQEWITGYKQKYEDDRKPFLQKMSANFRKQHDAEMNGLRIRAQTDRLHLLTQGRVQRATDLTLGLLKDAALRGDEREYRRILDEAQNGEYPLFSAETRKKLELNYSNLADFGAARRAVEAGEVDIDKALTEKDKDGNYKNYPHLTIQEREQLRRAAVAERHEIEMREDNAFLAGINDGSNTKTPEELKAAHDRKEISDEQYNRRLSWVRARDARSEKAAHARSEQMKQEQEKKKQTGINAFKWDLAMTEFSSDPVKNARQQQELLSRAGEAFKGDLETLLKLRGEIIKSSQNGLNGKSDFQLPGGEEVLDFIREEYGETADEAKNLEYEYHWYKSSGNGSDDFMKARYYEVLDTAKAMLRASKPALEIKEYITKSVKSMRDGIIAQLMVPRRVIATGKDENGKRVIKYSDGSIEYEN